MYQILRKANELKKEGATRNDLRNILGTDSQLRRRIDNLAVKEGLLREEQRTYGKKTVTLYFKTAHGESLYDLISNHNTRARNMKFCRVRDLTR